MFSASPKKAESISNALIMRAVMTQSLRKVLIIDDDPFFLKVLTDNFRDNGFTVFNANDGIEGIKAYLETSPDVVISDLVMPRMGGVSTCMEIGRLAGDKSPVIVLLTSMFQEAPHEHDAPEMGASIHIPKSTRPVDIVIIVEQLLERGKYLQS
jgi:two-component system, OmpR family, response regulator